ncbi:MAG: hypothetical protein H5T86_16470, partial [Armatimonadetes bacterium]|nr:hypothetical protein [Armatimonadota bacterium]
MTSLLALFWVVSTAPSGAVRVFVVSPDPAASGAVVAPLVGVTPVTDASGLPSGSVVWVAAECDELDGSVAETLLSWAERGGTLVVEDAGRLIPDVVRPRLGFSMGTVTNTEPQPAKVVHASHPAVCSIPFARWRLAGIGGQAPVVSAGTDVIVATTAGWPVLWTAKVGRGKAVCLAVGRRTVKPADIPGYDALLIQLLLAVARAPDEQLAEASARAAFRAWAYLCFPAGQALFRLREAVPDDYERAREAALRAWETAARRPAESRRLAEESIAASLRIARWAEEYWAKVPLSAVKKASARRELLLCPGTLDFVHSMNVSCGPAGWS